MNEQQRIIQRIHQINRWITSVTFNKDFTDEERAALLRAAKKEQRALTAQQVQEAGR